MNRLKTARFVCNLFPPIMSQQLRNRIFPLHEGVKLNMDFEKRSVTGSVFSGNTLDYHSYRFAVHGFFEWRNIVIARYFTSGKSGDIIEIGANVGTETLSYCDVIKGTGTVHAFESLPDNIRDLERMQNRLPNLRIYQNAISDREMEVAFQIPPKTSSGMGKIVLDGNPAVGNITTVKAVPLDNFADFTNVLFMSIDTEGHEPFVLAGSRKVIEKHQPAIVIEVSPKLLHRFANATILDIHNYFAALDYSCYKIKTLSLTEVSDADFQDEVSHNWLCVPKSRKSEIPKLSRALFIRSVVPWYLLPKLAY